MENNFIAEMTALGPEHKKLAEKLIKKMADYSHWPDSKKHGDKLLPFIESKEMVFLMAEISKEYKISDYPEFQEKNYIGYCTFIHIFILYIINKRENYEEIISVLNFLADKAVETVFREKNDNKWYMLKWIFDLYKAQKEPWLSDLAAKLDSVPDDKLWFRPINGDTAYEVSAYSEYTCGNIKIPSTYNGKPVKKIASYGFYNCKKLTGIEIPEGVEILDAHSFSSCKKLKNIILPGSLNEIGKFAFSSSGIQEITIPKNVEKMPEFVFTWTKITNIKVIGYSERPPGWDKNWNRKTTLNSDNEIHNVIWG